MTNSLGQTGRYFRADDPEYTPHMSLHAAIKAAPGAPQVDSAAVIEIVNRGYCFGERTPVAGVGWSTASPDEQPSGKEWAYGQMPEHGDAFAASDTIAEGVFHRLCEELRAVCEGRKKIGLLLSGGMDSRVVACVLHALQNSGELSASVVALNWGMESSRDVVYAARVCDLFGWEFRTFPLAPGTLETNITVAAQYGCEFSPVHLHAMADIATQKDIDLIVAASFGDSVGRAEFSGDHVTALKPISRHIYNRFKLIRDDVFRSFVARVHTDAGLYHDIFPRHHTYQSRELDYQLHYMQRMLVPCFRVIADSIPVHQAFTDPGVYGYMWSFSPACRTDRIYRDLLAAYGPGLLEIPWARTGRSYSDSSGPPDGYSRNNNKYGLWMRTELLEGLRSRVLSDTVARLDIFNMYALDAMLRYTSRQANEKATVLQETLAWIASLHEFAEAVNLEGPGLRSEKERTEMIKGRFFSVAHAAAFDGKLRLQELVRRLAK
ncbi:MAG: asparagine synthase-related protein [Gammaproteobacteria bacterium]|nr:asparagine synthase-related protein [Gammaproteobacteria bacterium]